MTMDEAKRTRYDYYRLLEVLVDCDQTEMKKAYRHLMLVHHPDKGGDENITKILNHAYDVLQDTVRRARYDDQGLENIG
ncbi:unnamed protein product [Ectocarpus sp. 12 AP-2014]